MGDSLEGSESAPENQNVGIADFTAFANYLRKAATVLLPEDDGLEPPALNAALEDKNNQDCIRKFLSDSQVTTLFIQRISSKGERWRMQFFLFAFLSRFGYFCRRRQRSTSGRRRRERTGFLLHMQ